ncbi:MAG: diadenylate cyclase CdaA [Candidatus Hydrogenedentota bacterium]|nr:MAG: diadenylate cyclase CdaA [Candidatus Hydrogenedentota bacterium]
MTHFFSELIQTFRLADFFDIAIISVLIYVVLMWFKATASRFVLLGIIVVGIVYIIARFFNMYLSAVVLQAFFAILIIALVIIFQEELRRFFERLGVWGAIRKRDAMVSGYPEIEILTRALTNLTLKKIGALVVIRGNDPLGRHLEGGFDLDGRLSETLLASIFDPHSPGHDGAAVVEEGRVTRFGCHLPLSINMDKIGHLGTRHSAALGLAERSDALCIAVSEEQGTISLAQEEQLEELSDPSQLQAALERFYLGKFPKAGQRTWRRWIRENSREKVLAVLLSCGLWFVFVFQTGTIRRDFVVPIEYRNLAFDWVIEEPKPKETTITLLGRGRAFDLLDVRTLKITLDMSEIKDGTQEMILSRDSVRRPSSLSVVALEPGKISLTAYQLITFNLPVEVQTSGHVPADFRLAGIDVSPESIPVMISSKLHSGSLKALTEPIDLRKLTQTTTLTPGLILPNGAKFGDQKPPKVEVKITVMKKAENQGGE